MRSPLQVARTARWLVVACGLAGCQAKELGAHVSATRTVQVNSTWVSAVRNCWPDVAQAHKDKYISDALSDPIGFRGAFSGFAGYTDSQIETIATHTVNDAPDPDTLSFRSTNTPLLTRAQAVSDTPVHTPNAPSAYDSAQIPPDTLCAIHPGTPVGFR